MSLLKWEGQAFYKWKEEVIIVVSTINEATKKNLRDFFEQVIGEIIFCDNIITRERFFDRFEYFISPKGENITLSLDEKVKILLFLKEALANYICLKSSTDEQMSERYIKFLIDPCDIEKWEAMMNCIYDKDKKENSCFF